MTIKSGFLVFILIASGCLSKACGDGEISTSPRSFEAAPTPDQPNVDEPTTDQSDVARRAGPLGDPYVHVTPADVGVTVGPGVIAAYPTTEYTGSCTLANTTVANVLINNCSSLTIRENVTLRNVVANLPSAARGIWFDRGPGTESPNLTIEYSYINASSPDAKVFQAYGESNGFDDHRNFVLRHSEIRGGHDYFYIEGQLDGWTVENNVFSAYAIGDAATDYHSDGVHLGQCPNRDCDTDGTMIFRGNYWEHDAPWAGKTALLWSTGGTDLNNTIMIWENNRFTQWGGRTIACIDSDYCEFRYNTYSQAWEDTIGTRCSCSGTPTQQCCLAPSKAVQFGDAYNEANSVYECNRYESDGDFMEQQYIDGNVTHITTGCPSYPR